MSAGRSGAERLAAKFGRHLAALDHHAAGAVLHGLEPAGSVRRRDKAQPHGRLLHRTERAAGNKADDLPVPQHRFVVVQDGIRIGQPDGAQTGALRVGLARQAGILANEGERLAGLADEVESKLLRRLGIGHVRPPVQKALLDAKGVERLAAGKPQAERLASLQNDFEHMFREIGRDENLPPRLAGK